MWILYAFGSAICFTIGNEAISEITSKIGPVCIFYFATGGVFCGILYHTVNLCKKKSKRTNMSLIIKGKLDFI